MEPLVSICIPVYEMRGKGVEYLKHSLNILINQTYKNFEVIISDNSQDNEIEKVCNDFKDKLSIHHHYNDREPKGMSSNINNALLKANGEIIKILFQDDFLVDNNSLEQQLIHFVGNHNHWLITACCHSKDDLRFYNSFYPKYHDNIHYGENTISSPSVLMFRNEDVELFDENLFWLMDVDYYKRLYDKFGFPSICNYITVVIREHSNQVSHTLATEERRKKELNYITQKYK
jgi:glycosyltransferase involved in cell wall biosynthesis